MDVSDARDGSVAPGTAEELHGRTPSDSGASWLNTGLSNENGNSLVVQVMSEANPALQNFFMENCNSAAPGQVRVSIHMCRPKLGWMCREWWLMLQAMC